MCYNKNDCLSRNYNTCEIDNNCNWLNKFYAMQDKVTKAQEITIMIHKKVKDLWNKAFVLIN